MSGYIGATTFSFDVTEADIKGDIKSTDASPEVTLQNTTEEDTDGGRESKITFKGEQSGGEITTLAQIQASHDGTADDEKGDLIFSTNDGADGNTPTERMRIDANGYVGLNTASPTSPLHVVGNSSSDFKEGGIRINDTNHSSDWFIGGSGSGRLQIAEAAGSTRMVFDTSGNVGIGATPQWSGGVLQFAGQYSTGQYGWAQNLYFDGSTYRAISSGGGCLVQMGSDFLIYNSPSTTADGVATLNESMRIDTYGRMGINDSTPYAMLNVYSSSSITSDGQLVTLVDNINRYGVGYHQTNASFTSTMELRYTTRTQGNDFFFTRFSSNSAIDTEFNFRGDGQAYADGSWNGGGADYAEYFEWADGNTSDEDRVGYTVVLDGDKIRKATSSDDASNIIGAVSANPSVIGDTDIDAWKHKYLRDDFGRYLRDPHNVVAWTETVVEEEAVAEVLDEDGNVITHAKEAVTKEVEHSYEDWNIPDGITVPDDATTSATDENGKAFTHRRPNPDYDPDRPYVTREDRPEWATIGMMGKLRIRTGQPVGDRWIKMRDVSNTVEEWLVR